MTLPLAGLVVVDIAGTIATAYCARLFADAGASVWNAEPAGGFATRSMPPLLDGESALHAWLSTGKQSVVVDRDDDTWHPLQTGANLVLHAGEPRLPIRDGCIGLDVSWFGSSGPYADYLGSDAACFALAGMVRMIGPVEGPPLLPSGYQTQIVAGAVAYIAALGHLVGAEQGRAVATRLELSILEATLCFTEVAPIAAFNNAFSTRMGINRYPPTYPLGIYHCHDGWLGVTALTPSQWKSFCRLIGMDDVADRPEYQSALGRLADAAVLEPRIRALLAERSAEDTFHEGQRRRIPLARVPTMAEMTNVDQFVSRKAFAQARLSNGRRVDVPVAPYRLRGTPLHGGGAVAALGAHEELPEAARAYTAGDDLPLAGIRIIDLSMGWAGPLAGRHLADLGADVVKVESCERFDWWRSWEATPAWIADQGAEKAVSHNMVNRNKRAITLDLEHPAGRELLLDLVRDAHAVLENYSAGVLPQLGLTYEVLRSVNPSVILLSMPAFGTTGPWAGFRAYGSTVEHSSGLPHLNGRPDDPSDDGTRRLRRSRGRHQRRRGAADGTAAPGPKPARQFVDLSQTEARCCRSPFTASSTMPCTGILAPTGQPPP
ncbi:MAG: CoA transferase [Pseudomonadales bacterium]